MVIRRVRELSAILAAGMRSASPGRIVFELVLAIVVAAVTRYSTTGDHELIFELAGFFTALVVPWRHRFPVAVIVISAVIGLAVGGMSVVVLCFLSVGAGRRVPSIRWTAPAYAIVLVTRTAGVAIFEVLTPSRALVTAAGVVFAGLLPAVIAWMTTQRRTTISAVHELNLKLHRESDSAAEQARQRERTRIARDLHDSLGHKLTLMSLYTATLPNQPEATRDETIALLRTTSATAMTELRAILGVLNVDTGDTATSHSLSSLDELIDSIRATGTPIVLTRGGAPRPLSPMTEHAAYRTIQEGITNAMKHAPGAPIAVSLRYEGDTLLAEVTNGSGTGAPRGTSGRNGLIGLDERIRLAGGMLHHGPLMAGGFRLAAMLPYAAPAPATARAAEIPRQLEAATRRFRWGLAAVVVCVLAIIVLCSVALVFSQ